VRHLSASFARIWTLEKSEKVLELQASAGMYTHLDGPHSHVRVGELEVGHIAQALKPRLTNDILNDSLIDDKAWAKKEGIVAFAGHPLIAGNRLVGVMAMFSREPLAPSTLDVLASVADTIAQGIERKRAEEELARSRDRLRELASRLHSAQEAERTRIAREIHDELGQLLPGLHIEMTGIARHLRRDQQDLREKVGAASRLIESSIASVRMIATELRPGLLDSLGLEAAIESQVEEFQLRTGVICSTELPPAKLKLKNEQATALFRILQESFTNIARHAQARHANVRLATVNGRLVLEITDDGRGILPEDETKAPSLGIVGMRERAFVLGGKVEITGQPGRGTTVRVSLPIEMPASVRVQT